MLKALEKFISGAFNLKRRKGMTNNEYICDICGKELTEDTVHVINNDDKYYCERCYPLYNEIDKAMYQKEAKE